MKTTIFVLMGLLVCGSVALAQSSMTITINGDSHTYTLPAGPTGPVGLTGATGATGPAGTCPSNCPTPTPTSTPIPTPGGITATNCPQPSVCASVTCPTSTNWVNPLNTGAFGDGTHDDTSAIQAALNSGDVCFPSGKTYLVNGSISLFSRKLQAGMIGGAAPIIKNTNSTFCNGIGCALFAIQDDNSSIIGLDFEGQNVAPPKWNNYPQGYNIAVATEGSSAKNTLIAGNTFNAWFGQAEVEMYSSSCQDASGSAVAFNAFENSGLWGFITDGVKGVSIHDNTYLDASDGAENDSSGNGQCAGDTWNHEMVTVVNGDGYQVSNGQCTMLSGGAAAGADYSANLVENSTISGLGSCLWKSSATSGGTMAAYTGDICTNGCVTK